jgi:hypothetical protein
VEQFRNGLMRDHISMDERLRRIGELLLKGVHLWSEATEHARPYLTTGDPVFVHGAETAVHVTANSSTMESPSARRIADGAARRRVREPRRVKSESRKARSETSRHHE